MDEEILNEARIKIASFLKKRRIELNLSQEEVSARSGITRKTINVIEQAKFWPGMKQYLLICHALHLFPTVVEMESNTSIAEALRQTWNANPKAMQLKEALDKKAKRYDRDGVEN